jgi:hypothetical protein
MRMLNGMLPRFVALAGLVAVSGLLPVPASAAGGRVNNLKVLSDRVEDVTTLENILRSFARPGMSDQERATALWTAAVKYRHQAPPPNEHLAADWEAHDPVKLFNVYGYSQCCCASAIIAALNRADGRDARGRILNAHSVPEVFHGGSWHLYDASLITYFPKPDGAIASVDEIATAVRGWLDQHPEYRGNDVKLRELNARNGWTAWKSEGPALLAACPWYDRGWFPAGTHGWYATMQEYDRESEVYEYGYHLGHRALFSLRPGESLIREAGNRGLHVNGQPDLELLKQKAPEGDLKYLTRFMPGYNGGVIGNGVHRYAPDLASGGLALGAEVYENLATGSSPALRSRAAGRSGIAVIRMTSPYVYLDGRVRLRALRRALGDVVRLSLSTNNGRTYTPLWTASKTGAHEATVDLGERVRRRYAYLLKVELRGATPASAGLDALVIENDIQHAPRTLPWLGKGKNTLTVAADQPSSVAALTVTGRITDDAAFTANESTRSLGVTFDNLNVQDGSCWWKGGTGTMTVPIEAPGPLTGLRFGAQVRARGEKDLVRMLASYDGGKSWSAVGRIAGPTAGTTRYFQTTAIPPGVRKALLRYELTGNNTVGLFSFRVDADYRDPLASSGVRPFRVTHRWRENGAEKRYGETIGSLPATYDITTAADPAMVSVSYEMPAK